MPDENKSPAPAADSTSSKAVAAPPPVTPRPVASYSHIGAREEQQDSLKIWEDKAKGNMLVVVCDGVGGSRGGGQASTVVIRTAEQLWTDRSGVLADPRKDLLSMSRVAHDRICDLTEAGEKRSPASTVVALYLTPKEAHWIHSGDSRLYRFRGGSLTGRTRDHSVVQVLVDQGEVSEEEMGTHPDQGRLLQSLGTRDFREPTYGKETVEPEDGFLLCTDGFWERIPVPTMAALLLSHNVHELEGRLRKSVMRAVHLNGETGDNVSVAAVAPLKVVTPAGSRAHLLLLAALGLLAAVLVVGGLVWFAAKKGAGRKADESQEIQGLSRDGKGSQGGPDEKFRGIGEIRNPPDPPAAGIEVSPGDKIPGELPNPRPPADGAPPDPMPEVKEPAAPPPDVKAPPDFQNPVEPASEGSPQQGNDSNLP